MNNFMKIFYENFHMKLHMNSMKIVQLDGQCFINFLMKYHDRKNYTQMTDKK